MWRKLLNYLQNIIMNDFMPKDYEVPKSQGGGYMKFKKWDNKFRILDSMIVWYEYFTVENKPKRSPEYPWSTPNDIKDDWKVKHFWAFPVWNYQDEAIQILEVTQVSIQESIEAYVKNEKRGSPFEYDIIVNRSGEWLETKYQVTVDPKEALSKEIEEAKKEMNIDMNQLFLGDSPFVDSKEEKKEEDNLPF